MDEQNISQPQETEDIWVDEAPDEMDTDDIEESAEEPVEEPEKESEPDTTPETIKIKYNGEELDLPMEEVVTLAQKGKNYDKVFSRVGELEASIQKMQPYADAIQKYAGIYGFDSGDAYLAHLNGTMEKAEVKRVAEEQGISEELAQKQVALQRENAELKEQAKAQQVSQADLEPWEELLREYPDVGKEFDKEPPKELLELVMKGMSPLAAYEVMKRDAKIAELESAITVMAPKKAAEKADQKNRDRTPGSVESEGDNEGTDPFLRGFLSD